LEKVRTRVVASIPQPNHPADAISVPDDVRPPLPAPLPIIAPGDFAQAPALDEYRNAGTTEAADFIALAVRLENEGQFQRALLAWERVIDTGKPDDFQATTALSAIQRLRPTLPDWNTDPASAIAVTLHAGTGKATAKILAPALEEVALELERASAGILNFSAQVNASKSDLAASGPVPVAIWITGHTENAPSSEVLSFTVHSPESLRDVLRLTIFRLIRAYLARTTTHTPPPLLGENEKPLTALGSHISRLSWQELGKRLNPPAHTGP
jgi:hypothetical protein